MAKRQNNDGSRRSENHTQLLPVRYGRTTVPARVLEYWYVYRISIQTIEVSGYLKCDRYPGTAVLGSSKYFKVLKNT